MELRQLKYFVTVAHLGSYTQASKALFITQSTISQQIRNLEDELGVDLLIRDTRHVTLSDYGEQFYKYALKILEDAQAGVERIQDVKKLHVGTLSIGSTYSFDPLLRQTVIDFSRRYPHIRLNILSTSKEILREKLLNRELDLALSYKSTVGDERVESHLLFRSQLCLIGRKDSFKDHPKEIRVEDLANYPLALPSKGLQARDTLDSILFGSNIKLDIRLEINSIHDLMNLVGDSSLFTALSSEAIHHRDYFEAIPIVHPDGRMDGCYHFLKGPYRRASALKFVELLTENNSFNQTFS